MSNLYLVVTPIGNLDDISKRAIDTLNKVDFIACENPNNSLKLLQNLNISKKLLQINGIHEVEMSNKVLKLLLDGNDVAYISDAGYPCISDPGNILTSLAIENNINVSVVGGNNAMLTALVASGLNTTNFTFIGFLSSKTGTAKNQLENLKNHCETLIFYESSHRIKDTLKLMHEVFKDRKVCIAKELTKVHEQYIRINLNEIDSIDESILKGEFVIVVEGKIETENVDYSIYCNKVSELVSLGVKTKDAAEYVAKENNVSKNTLYNLYLKSK